MENVNMQKVTMIQKNKFYEEKPEPSMKHEIWTPLPFSKLPLKMTAKECRRQTHMDKQERKWQQTGDVNRLGKKESW